MSLNALDSRLRGNDEIVVNQSFLRSARTVGSVFGNHEVDALIIGI